MTSIRELSNNEINAVSGGGLSVSAATAVGLSVSVDGVNSLLGTAGGVVDGLVGGVTGVVGGLLGALGSIEL